MKRWMAAALAALLVLALCACQKEPAPEQDPPEEPVTEEPQTPTEMEEEDEDPAVRPEEPDTPPAEGGETGDPAGVATVADSMSEGQVEESVSYRLKMPGVTTGNATVDQILGDYYAAAAGKVEDLCWGEVYEEALASGNLYHVDTDYTVMRNDGEILSVYRTVTVTNINTSQMQTTAYGETFDLASGGLLTAGDFFAVDQATYMARLADCVCRQIQEDPYHSDNYYAQWESLATSALDRDRFYVTDEAYCVFYQQGDLGLGGKTVFEIPWSQLADLLA